MGKPFAMGVSFLVFAVGWSAGYGVRRFFTVSKLGFLWEWLPATIPSRQDAAPTKNMLPGMDRKEIIS
jgi:hypothetical protein